MKGEQDIDVPRSHSFLQWKVFLGNSPKWVSVTHLCPWKGSAIVCSMHSLWGTVCSMSYSVQYELQCAVCIHPELQCAGSNCRWPVVQSIDGGHSDTAQHPNLSGWKKNLHVPRPLWPTVTRPSTNDKTKAHIQTDDILHSFLTLSSSLLPLRTVWHLSFIRAREQTAWKTKLCVGGWGRGGGGVVSCLIQHIDYVINI